jgi:GNAT superfamily N-acetyltransferase
MARSGHVKKIARDGEAERHGVCVHIGMQARYANGISIRTLRNGDSDTILSVFDRMSDKSRSQRFGGPKPRLSETELTLLSRVDATHHVLVAYVDGEPAGIARLVRDGRTAEVAFAVVDEHQGRKVGTALARELAADARAAGIAELHATITGDHRRVSALLSRSAHRLRATWLGGECSLVAALD